MERYAAEAREMLLDKVQEYTENYSENFMDGRGSTEIRESIKKAIILDMRVDLFHKVKCERIVTPPHRMVYNPSTGIYRRRERPLDMSDIPRKYLDVPALIPDLDSIVEDIFLGAYRLAMEKKIKAVTRESTEADAEQ